ncbi:hypothetical protein D1159_04420 [Pseudoflavonifractor sp. 524-17]|uniref:hypothetical protein n=1 Tax=Pseudoflavonifractor sp. 524-17 TaxID=2304577 RepID=UPI0013796761|nr:hypothetical protein [Pseudoflavonifractor sp. 524-17]NCE63844.1 hypothetical protein [Pseudoflavonifractor sp. 524-17]
MNSSQQPHSGELQHEAEHARPRNRSAVMTYLVILFAAAFLLLLLSYFMQERVNRETIGTLESQSVSAVQTLDNIMAENQRLVEENQHLEEQVDQLEDDLSIVRGQLAAERNDLQASRDKEEELYLALYAMDWLREIQGLYEKQYYKAARAMILEFEATGLPEALPGTSLHTYDGSDILSPEESYQAIVAALYPDGLPEPTPEPSPAP